jgi:UDP:flavonoid glycosyltransferase YjiC (YdhE family)
VVSTAGRYLPIELSDRVWTADYIPGLQAAARAAFVICNGGSAPVYQAFMAGKPVLGIPCNLDQYLMMDYVSTFGAGVAVRTGQASAEALAEAVEHLLQDSRYKDRAALLQATIQSRQGLASFAGLVDELVEGRGERKHDTRPVRAEGELVGSETRLASEQR